MEPDGQWTFTLDVYDDGGGLLAFAIDIDEDMVGQPPRELLRHLLTVGLYILDHDLLDGADEDYDD